MLGTLAKWLRILGYDTLYESSLDDHQLVRLSRAEDRVLLTRDRELARRRGLRVLLVTGEDLDEQLRQVLAYLPASTAGRQEDNTADQSFTRCPVCNEVLQPMDLETARTRVPEYVAQTQTTFRTCPTCKRVYWRGTHWQRMGEHLARMAAAGQRADDGVHP